MWYMPAPASSASRREMSAIVVERKVVQRLHSFLPDAAGLLALLADDAVEGLNYLEDGDLVGGLGERVAALRPAVADQDPGTAERREELLEELDRNAPAVGDLADRHWVVAGARQLRERDHRVT